MNLLPSVLKRKVEEAGESAFMTTQEKKTYQANKEWKGKAPLETCIKKESQGRLCRKKGHIKPDFVKYQQWLVMKCTSISLVFYEANMIDALNLITKPSKLNCANSSVVFMAKITKVEVEGMIHKVKQFPSKIFDMKDMGDASYVIDIKIIEIDIKGNKFTLNQCPTNNLEREQMKGIPYASIVGNLHAQVCTRPDIAFVVGMLGRFQNNTSLDHQRAAKKVLRYLQGTKDYMLMYKRPDDLEVIGYSDSDAAGCVDSQK
ncbi:hypothetical protein KY284_010124 [Solanum tuberosum]|nr:hypothetical protein KY284_010124 [Solanum tuberosum]